MATHEKRRQVVLRRLKGKEQTWRKQIKQDIPQINPTTRQRNNSNPTDFKPNCEKVDSVVWLPHPNGSSVNSAWEAIRLRLPVQQWSKVIW